MAVTETQGIIARSEADNYGLGAFCNINSQAISNKIVTGVDGKFGIGWLSYLKFTGLDIPVGNFVTSATITGHYLARAGLLEVIPKIRLLKPDAIWNVSSFTTGNSLARLAFCRDMWLHARTSAPATLAKTLVVPPGPTTGYWNMRHSSDTHDRLTQGFRATATGTVADVQVYLQRSGTVAGTNNFTVEIWTNNIFAGNSPGTFIAASDPITASTVPTTGTLTTMTFTGGPTLTSGVQYVLVYKPTYAVGTGILRGGFRELFLGGPYANGIAGCQGTDTDFGRQNFPLDQTLGQIPRYTRTTDWTGLFGEPTGTTYTSPDFSEGIMEHITAPGYANDGVIGIEFKDDTAVPGNFLNWASFDHVSAPSFVLDVVSRPRRVYVT